MFAADDVGAVLLDYLLAMTDALTIVLPPPVHDCPECRNPAELVFTQPPQPKFAWTDGWIERRDGSGIPAGWVKCPHCDRIADHRAWKRTTTAVATKERLPPTREPSVEALRAHIEELLKGQIEADRVRDLQVQLWWLANARRRGAKSPPPLEEPESRNLFRVMRPPDAPGFEGGLRRIEALRELGQFEQASKAIAEVRARLDRLDALVNQRDPFPRLWDPSKPIEWPAPQPWPPNADVL